MAPASPPSPAPARHIRIDRRDLADDRQVWLIYAVVFGIVGCSTAVSPLLWPDLFARERMWPFAAGLLAIAVASALSKPPPIGGIRNHLLVFSVPFMTALGLVAYAPHSTAPAAAAIFAGTLTAGRLTARREIVAHYVVGSALLVLLAGVSGVDAATRIALISVLPGVWVLGWCGTLILEAAEAQGRELVSLVRRDPLTGVGNRRLLDETLSTELPRHAEHGRELSVIALDLNGFKALNDQVGHDAGDALLRVVASTLRSTVGAGDIVVRQGGDEFCVLLPETGAIEAAAVRDAIDAALGAIGGGAGGITTGAGIATFPHDATDAASLLAAADAGLAADKAAHRAQPRAIPSVVVAPETVSQHGPMATDGSTRVSRRQLAVNLTVWRAQGVLISFYSLLLGGIALFSLEGADPQRTAFAYCIVLAVVAYFTLRHEPPAIGTALNHAVIALPYVGATAVVLIAPQVATACLGPFALGGALASVRLTDRRQIVAHWVAATVCIVGLMASGIVDIPATLGLLLVILVVWGLGAGDMVYLERSEEQGDELERLVRRDPLTGLGNRRVLAEQLDAEVQRSGRTGRPFTVIALDLNGFKALNDALGHAAGDTLLLDVADRMVAAAREGDTLVRQGGDEFCLLLPETSAADAVPIANAVRAAIAGLSRNGHRITTGAGAATFPADATTADVLLYVADERLRADKAPRSGRTGAAESPRLARPSLTILGEADRAAGG
ncbi:MAG: GGDEF domain-containing protein [Solirubrobacteraceae bacterium]|nr:GGDEF domain-containing protein [Solirubrobacteraceae bacterium]